MRRSIRPSFRLPGRSAAMVAAVALVALALAGTIGPPGSSPAGSTAPIARSAAGDPPVAVAPRFAAPAASAAVTTATTPPSVPGLALVPIVGFWSTLRSLSLGDLRAALAGRDRRFRQVLVADPDLAALEIGLRARAGPVVRHLSAKAVIAAVKGHRDVLGIVRAADVRPAVRALGVAGRTLFGNARLRSIGDWPLTVPALRSAGSSAGSAGFDPAASWTLVAAGDVMNDREVHRRTVLLGRGPDFPWNGGTARIVSRSCCSVGLPFVRAIRTGGAGAVRALFRDADLSLVNHEGPAPDNFRYHPTGLVFTFDPHLEVGIRRAGVDVVSLANNHIRNAGSAGVIQTIRNVKAAGLVPVGAGKDAKSARRPVWFTVDGVRVAILAFDAIDLYAAGATATRAGAAPLDIAHCRADVKAARAAGADVVIVVPHWGVEYTSNPTALQRSQAAALIGAGADVILGSHPHWAGALEAIGNGLVVYSMGDFIFDLPRSEQTDEGLIVELTFVGRRVVQIDIHPTIELDRSQPHLLDPARDGRVVLDRVRKASRPFLDW
jgi:Bacterial capsule synthesis protein PGA_cap